LRRDVFIKKTTKERMVHLGGLEVRSFSKHRLARNANGERTQRLPCNGTRGADDGGVIDVGRGQEAGIGVVILEAKSGRSDDGHCSRMMLECRLQIVDVINDVLDDLELGELLVAGHVGHDVLQLGQQLLHLLGDQSGLLRGGLRGGEALLGGNSRGGLKLVAGGFTCLHFA